MASKTKTVMKISPFKVFLYVFFVGFVMMIFIGISVLSGHDYRDNDPSMPEFFDPHSDDAAVLKEKITCPIIIWWTGFTEEPGKYQHCGSDQCFFTIDKHYYHHPSTKVFAFYGTDFYPKNVPMPRKPWHEWALLHEESPKNNYIFSFKEALELFNHTSTFSRYSDFPLMTQHIETLAWLESKKYLVPTREKNQYMKELAPVLYVQSDCTTASDRDSYVTMLMKEIMVDSYGACLHNKDLPKHLVEPLEGYEHDDFYKLTSKYKFTLAMENGHCDDYVTEKLWRPLMLGSVPVVDGSSKVRDLLPDNHSAIIIDDFKSVKELADYLKFLNENDEEYEKYLQWKQTGITNKWLIDLMKKRPWAIKETWKTDESNFIEGFECFVCERVNGNIKREKAGLEKKKYIASETHFPCPEPKDYDYLGKRTKQSRHWLYDWNQMKYEAKALRYFADRNEKVEKGDFNAKVSELKYYGV